MGFILDSVMMDEAALNYFKSLGLQDFKKIFLNSLNTITVLITEKNGNIVQCIKAHLINASMLNKSINYLRILLKSVRLDVAALYSLFCWKKTLLNFTFYINSGKYKKY